MAKITLLRTTENRLLSLAGLERVPGWGLAVVLLVAQAALGALPSVETIGSYAAGLRAPARLALDLHGNLYAADSLAGRVFKFDPFGRPLVVQDVPRALAIAVDGSGNLLVGQEGSGSVTVFDAQGSLIYKLGRGDGEFALPNFIAPDLTPGSTRVYVSDSIGNQVKVYDKGAFTFAFGTPGANPGQFNFPTGIWVSKDREVFVVDQGNDRIQVFGPGGQLQRYFSLVTKLGSGASTSGGRSQGITGDAFGRIYVSDTFQDLIRVFTTQGAYLGSIGGIGEAAGQFRSPAGLAIDEQNRLFVASANNSRVELIGLDSFLHVSVSPGNRVVSAGTDARFSARCGDPGPLTYRWQKDGVDVNDGGGVAGSQTATLVLGRVSSADSGSYSVNVSRDGKLISSPPADLIVVTPPSIVSAPTSQTVGVGSNVLFRVATAGDSPFYQWSHGGRQLVGETSNSLTLKSVTRADAGTYTVSVTNAAGLAVATASLSVQVPPSIVMQPTTSFIVQGESGVFEVFAEGDELVYQWFFNGTPIAGQTGNRFPLTAAQPEQAGLYSVSIRNAIGSLTSDAAQLVVLTPPSQAPEIASMSFSTQSQPELSIAAPPGYRFAIEASEDLQSWTTVSRFETRGGSYQFADPDAVKLPLRFYRVRWLPQFGY